jgi:hypothetical protein
MRRRVISESRKVWETLRELSILHKKINKHDMGTTDALQVLYCFNYCQNTIGPTA